MRNELYKYNPGQCSPEEIEATFVAREGILESILDELRARTKSRSNQHFLLIGPRGIGKTNLLIMIRTQVNKDKELSGAYVALQTAEEEYSISSLRDFFSRILELLIEEVSDSDLGLVCQSIASTRNDEHAAEIAIRALKDFCKRSRKKILLLVDNLDLILGEQITDDAQIGRLRDVLMNDSFLVIVGAAPTHFKEVSGYERPFYNFFRLMELEDLSAEQMAELLRKRAEWDNNPAILDRFEELKPRLNAIYHLTGGNPRLALMLYQFYTSTELPEVRTAIQMLLDDLTPYYKARLEKLPPQQRKVMDAFARFGQPVTPTELAQETRLPVNQINSILKRLRELGFVSIPPQQRRKTTLYIVSERVFRIWHQMRFSTPTRRRLEFLIEFIRIWYTSGEWKREVDRLMGEYRNAVSEKRLMDVERFGEHLEYFAEAAPKMEWRYVVEDKTVLMFIESGDHRRAEEIIKERIQKYSAQCNSDRLAESWFLMAYLRNMQNRTEDEMSALNAAVKFRPNFFVALFNLGSVLDELARSKSGAEQQSLFQLAIEKYDAALKIKPNTYQAVNNWGSILNYLARNKTGVEQDVLYQQAIEKFEQAMKIKPDMPIVLVNLGTALKGLARTKSGVEREHLYEQAFDKYERALKLKPDLPVALNNWGNALAELAYTKSGAEQEHQLLVACDKYKKAIQIAKSQKPASAILFYSSNLVSTSLDRCALAVGAENLGDARELFTDALDYLPKAHIKSSRKALVRFFSAVLTERTAPFCAQLFDAMREQNMENELNLLAAFVTATDYWLKGKDEEVLDRLNPEVREIVEDIIKGKAKFRVEPSNSEK